MPIDIVIVPATGAATSAAGGGRGHARHGSARAIAASSTGGSGGVEPAGPTAPAEPGKARVLGPSSDFIADFLANSKPLAPPDPIPGETVRDQLTAARARLRRTTSDAERDALRQQIVALADQLRAEELKPAGGGSYRSDQGVFRVRVDPDGTTHLDDAANLQVHGTSGSFDTTDWVMRSHGQDPYARRKLAFLDRTREQRVAIGKRYRKQQLSRSAQLARANVDRLWATTTDLAERKRTLFELWDECAETGDADLVAGGAEARRLIVGVIRVRLRGAAAYTAAELAAFNARRQSRARFAPYDDDP